MRRSPLRLAMIRVDGGHAAERVDEKVAVETGARGESAVGRR